MVEGRLELEMEVQKVFELIDGGKNFLLSGGAGSGKTYSLVQVIRQIIVENPTVKIACMTYTNAAVKEIEDRVDHPNLNVSTIHDFLWDSIKNFQKELRKALVFLINSEEISQHSMDTPSPLPDNYFDTFSPGIQYKDYLRLRDGIISHDELLVVSSYLFKKYPKLCDIVKDKYPFILIDEYQDTSPSVVEIFLTDFKKSQKSTVVGFFGDSMQAIYDGSVGNLDSYRDEVFEVKKNQNRRNPKKVIELANRLRKDGIVQEAGADLGAPNLVNGILKEGEILFLYSSEPSVIKAKGYLEEYHSWSFNGLNDTKELNLTHNLIAEKAGFRKLMDIYDKDPVIGLKGDILRRIRDNEKNGKPAVPIDDSDTFDMVVDKFKLVNKQRQLKM
ncbi:UvrD-helicase domain-containing protein [Chitinophaga eiseniae]|uniref:ATP-dependent helicase n=1 Tax=Chitinophaga eiseniae TaxID=634771 RepID=A0A847SSG3_9BACT|nr:UvrD-helicase domain-containing protein [Chitinophaga eiseniae]NLR82027.1 ATP-dependent helicase [Chitinophaga eiseniae]